MGREFPRLGHAPLPNLVPGPTWTGLVTNKTHDLPAQSLGLAGCQGVT